MSAFCTTPVEALGVAPAALLCFVGAPELRTLVRTLGPARTPADHDAALREARAWASYKARLLQSLQAEREAERDGPVQQTIGRRRLPRRPVTAGAPPEDLAPSCAAGAAGAALVARLDRQMQAMVHGVAAAEMQAFPPERGLAIVERSLLQRYKEPGGGKGLPRPVKLERAPEAAIAGA
jgi:hypothetical protein